MSWIINIHTSNNRASILNIAIFHYASCLIWYLVPLSSQFTMKLPLFTAHQYIKSIDQGWVELLRGQGVFNSIKLTSNYIYSSTPKHPILFLRVSITILLSVILVSGVSNV
jgi:hypothetical protein